MEIIFDGTLQGWRRAARDALVRAHPPEAVTWRDARSPQGELELPGLVTETAPAPDALTSAPPPPETRVRVPREFLALTEDVACHREPARWALLYRALWRLTHDEPHLLEISTDADVQALHAMAKTVRRDLHKMRAFVRFREVATDEGPWFVAWFEPEHPIVEANAPFFRDRFTGMRWSILTPDRCAHWVPATRALTFTPGVPRHAAPAADAMEELWRTYYASIFNPARLKLGAMRKEMPRRYWANLPEAPLIAPLTAAARPRADTMVAHSAAAVAGQSEFSVTPVPATGDLAALRHAAAGCRACPLWRNATCTVFGHGPARARVMIVGEQPGDREDRQGAPFVGPAGLLLNRAFAAAGIARETLYLTNAVKHFKWEPRGKRRLHQKPNTREIAACRPWLVAEIRAVRPELLVCLGATAAQSVLGRAVRVQSERGAAVPTEFGVPALLTVHPSSLLRLPDGAEPEVEFARFVADLQRVPAALRPIAPGNSLPPTPPAPEKD